MNEVLFVASVETNIIALVKHDKFQIITLLDFLYNFFLVFSETATSIRLSEPCSFEKKRSTRLGQHFLINVVKNIS